MRSFFKEGDLISAEIQSLKQDGATNLQTRNLKYGKLVNGLFVRVSNCLIKRTNTHFISMDAQWGIDLILGNNGYVWITNTKSKEEQTKIMNFAKEYKDFTPFLTKMDANVRISICRIRNCLLILDRNFIQISIKTIMSVFTQSIQRGIKVKDMLSGEDTDLIQDALFIVQQSL